MPDLKDIFYFCDLVLSYLTIHLGRCAVFSAILMSIIMVMRQLSKKESFIRGLSWSLLALAPFMGRLKIFSENIPCMKMTYWWTLLCTGHFGVGRVYFIGIAVSGFIFWNRRRKVALHG